jgi:hypothetical protein
LVDADGDKLTGFRIDPAEGFVAIVVPASPASTTRTSLPQAG